MYAIGYVLVEYVALRSLRLGIFNQMDIYVAGILLLIVVHTTYLEYGKMFASVLFLALFYSLYGTFFPGILQHQGFSLERLLTFSSLNLTGGMFGDIVGIIATWVAAFIIYAGFVQAFGGLNWVRNSGRYFGNFVSSGPTLTAVLSSLGFGMVSGSGAANTAITGSFTIPLMKDSQELPGRDAAAVESVSSSGGQIMPPLMGSSAFLMADLLNLPLATIILVGFFPAVIFFCTIAIMSHQLALSRGTPMTLDVEVTVRDI
jgi:TRAP-type uncharacterized transport system fused permease subunit